MNSVELRLAAVQARAAELVQELADIDDQSTAGDLDDDTRTELSERVATIEAEADELRTERADLEARLAKRAALAAAAADLTIVPVQDIPAPTDVRDGSPQVMHRVDPDTVDPTRAGRAEMRDAALALLAREADRTELDGRAAGKLERMIRSNSRNTDGDEIARRLALTERPAYRSAWMKYLASPTAPAWDADETRAVAEFRNQSLTNASGGFGVPVLIDPTIILTSGASDTPILRIARVETITNNVWRGVSAAPASWSYDAEGAAVSDDSITFTQPVVTTYMARAFIPYTIEIGGGGPDGGAGDYPNFAAEMRRVISEGYVQLIASQSATGSGSAPLGIFTAIDANAAREVICTTSGSLAPVDALTVWNHLGEKWRGRASWFGSVSVESQVRRDPGNIDGLYTVNLNSEGLTVLNGRPFYTSDYAPAFSGTTGTVNLLVVGDFDNYVVAQRAGMSVEAVPHLFDVTNNRPTGERGLFAWARHGMDSVNDNAFALLKNAT